MRILAWCGGSLVAAVTAVGVATLWAFSRSVLFVDDPDPTDGDLDDEIEALIRSIRPETDGRACDE